MTRPGWRNFAIVAVAGGLLIGLLEAFLRSRGVEPSAYTRLAFVPVVAVLGLSAAMLAGNRKERAADPGARAAALTGQPEPGAARLIVHRQGFVGKALGVDVRIDGAFAAQLKSPRFTAVDVPPGRHRVEAAMTREGSMQNEDGAVELELAEGETVAVAVSLKMGALRNRAELAAGPVDEALRRKLAGVRMVASEWKAAAFV